MKIDLVAVGKKIKEYRQSLDLTLKEFAIAMDVEENTARQWEKGKEKDLELWKLQKIAEVLKVDVRDLTGWSTPYRRPAGWEDKEKICLLFTPVLRECRAYPDLKSLEYKKGEDGETVTAVVEDPAGICPPTFITIDVTADSGMAMIKDILRALG